MKTRIIPCCSLGIAALCLVACGKSESTTSGSTGAGGMSSASVGTGVTSSQAGTGAQSTTSAASGTGGGASSGVGGTGGQGGGGQSALVPSLVSSALYVDCMPVVGVDPIHGSFNASYDNTQGKAPGSATLQSATLSFHGQNAADAWTFTASPKSSGNVGAGMTLGATHTKDDGSGKGTGSPCSYCGAGNTWTLTVTWDVGGKTVQDQLAPAPVSCVF